MWKSFVLLLCLSGYCLAGPVGTKRNMPIVQHRDEASSAVSSMESLVESEPAAMAELPMMSTLTLPSNATSIRADITDNFSCENKTYGYYADVDNDCQIFHVCLPVTYADGKENTFRWSFICPEETIFSQDSFTCMRPDDMTITCDESYQYYELNRNFGMVESNKDNTEMAAAESEKNESNETVMEAETQPEPMMHVEKEAPKPVQQAVKVQKPNRRKPVASYASQKKPNNSIPLRKLPQVQPVIPEMNDNKVAEDKTETEKPVQEEEVEEVKPLIQKFSRRPVSAVTNALKDKIESSRPESMNEVRTQFFNQNRKRPSMFNKKPVVQQEEPQQEMAPIQAESQTEQQTFSLLESDMSNNNAETQVADSEIQASENNEVFVNPEEPKEAEASMTNEESNKVEEIQTVEIPTENVKMEEPQQVLEAFEEIPAFISEVLETHAEAEEENKIDEQLPLMIAEESQITQESHNAEESQNAEELQNTEESQNAEELQNTEESQNAEESQNVEEPQNTEESQKHEEQTAEDIKTTEESQNPQESQTVDEQQVVDELQNADETAVAEETKSVEESQIVDETAASEEIQVNDKIENPQPVEEVQFIENVKPVEETLFVEEPQPVEALAPMENIQTAEESQIVQEIQTVAEEKPEPEVFPASEELVKTHLFAEPTIFENSDEGLAFAPSQTIEDMEDERPADAPESMQATDAMSYPSPMVQQMMDDLEDNKHSVGGFKPVDPVMAHEAEQLIADFINTLRNNDFTNETPGMIKHQYNNEESEKEQEQAHDNISVVEETEKLDNNEMTKEEASEVLEKTEEVEESVNSNEEVKEQTQPEVAEIQENNAEEIEAQTLSQETIAEEMEVAKEELQVLSQENNVEDMEDNKEEAQTLTQENNAEDMEVAKDEPQILSQENNAEEIQNTKEEPVEAQPETMAEENTDNQESIALKSLEAQSSENIEESLKSDEQQAESSNMMVMTNIPEEMYQIPVQIISAPEEEMPINQQESQAESDSASENKPIDMTASTEDKLEETAPAVLMGGYKPLSIDDIVELVKERLDHMPKDEMETPMQLEQVLGDMQEEKVSEEKSEAVEEEAKPAQSEEEIVMPIYQRTAQPVKVEAETQEQDLSIEQSEVAATDVKEKSNRSYRSRSMLTPKLDPRKRRFLFKSDKNKSS